MNRTALVISHICIFALGCSVALVSRKSSPEVGETVSGNGTRSSVSPSRPGGDGNRPGMRERREISERTGRGKGSPRESLGRINGMADTYERQRKLMDFLDGLSPERFAEVADEFRKSPHYDNQGSEMELLFRAWAKAAPLAALGYIEENPDAARNRDEVLETWAGADPDAAEKWALEKHEGEGENPYLASVIKGIAAQDINRASVLTQTMPPGRQRGEAIDAVAKALLMSGTDAAFAFPETVADEHLRGSFVALISRNLAARDPQAAADWVASLGDGATQARASGEVAARLARVDVKQAAGFVTSLQPEARANAAAASIPAMSQLNIEGTAKWVATLAGTPGYDKVVESFVWSCDERSPEQSAAWISGVSDAAAQEKLYHRMLGGWAQKDAVAVRNWVSQNEVPAGVKRRFVR